MAWLPEKASIGQCVKERSQWIEGVDWTVSSTVCWSLLFLPAPNVTQAPITATRHMRAPSLFLDCESFYIFKQLQKLCARETLCSLQNLKYLLSGSLRKTYANLCPRVTRGQLLPEWWLPSLLNTRGLQRPTGSEPPLGKLAELVWGVNRRP